MLHIKSLDEGLELFKALGSDIRVEIIKILLNENSMNMNELASRLNITNGALTSHIKKLEECGVVTVSSEASGHGNQKVCSVHLDKILIELQDKPKNENIYTTDIKVGLFSDYSVYPTCGLATSTRLIGEVDDTRYFAHPDRYEADILWFTKGYVEYAIPNFVPANQKIDEICVSLELSSEAPGVNNVWPSDIYFYLNDVLLGTWTSPGDFGDVKGIFTPDWWFPNWNQYGLLKMLVINHKGTYIDGLQISEASIDQFNITSKSQLKLKLEVPDNAEHVGGLTIFGRGFGNYNQDINVKMAYSPIEM
ncbi:winged helix-turn-helix transcriptional regulator [Butyrivibrio sp. CB08]|uniref:ArsR/SmtB family transcription factor n=1 Tax=Butyrivibrio sp. CB08 TaxID=2364879 RepID=UPI000EA95007|nr:winged helix-turn-helix transcriptional regulator [Butyrivibrio sp. CB08]RKM58763.1 winged helix-turn-helix transcriptional regulator [Butyrivibrio sp. CB08]